MMHRDEAIYARSDARGGLAFTDEERELIVDALRGNNWDQLALNTRAWIENNFMPGPNGDRAIAYAETAAARADALADRIERASTTPSP